MADQKQHQKQKQQQQQQQQQVDSIPGEQEQPVSPEENKPEQAYEPGRVCNIAQLETFNLLVHPIWVFDFIELRMRWANHAGQELWNAESLEELQSRDYKDISAASSRRMEEFLVKFDQGQHCFEQWTLYPKGKATTVHMNVSGVRVSDDDDHMCLLCEAIPVVQEEVMNDNLRGVEMLRHLPIAICQFDIEGKVMFQNPAGVLWKATDEDTTEVTESLEDASLADSTAHHSTASTTTAATEDYHDDMRSTTSTTAGNSIDHSQRKRKADTLLQRFVDPEIGSQVMKDIQIKDYVHMEAMLYTREGHAWSAIQMRRSKDPVTGESVILYSAQDKTDKIRARKEREARKQKAEFFAIMAHEIRTPLHQVTGFIDLLDQTVLDVEQKSFVKLLKSSSQGLMTVINDVLDYSKLEAGKMKLENIPYEPLMVLEGSLEAVRASCEEKNISLNIEWCKDIPFRLIGDPNRLRQILLNLLSNAVKFTKEGGITVQTIFLKDGSDVNGVLATTNNKEKNYVSKEKNPKASTNNCNKPMVKFVIVDTGEGVSDENKAVIFQQYQQANIAVARNHGGTGLGLSICQQLTQNMGGAIGVESEPGRGSSFWFVLPAEISTERDTPEVPEENTLIDVGVLNILVVEDNRVNQKLLANMLKRMGHTSSLAENGKVAIDMIEQGTFDLVLMDIQMPIMDGLEATRRLRTMGYNDLPIYGLTASVARSDFTELGFDDWLPKPIPLKELKTKLYRLSQRISMAVIQEKQ